MFLFWRSSSYSRKSGWGWVFSIEITRNIRDIVCKEILMLFV